MFKAAIKLRDSEFALELSLKTERGGLHLQKFSLVSAADQDDARGSFYSGIATGLIRIVAPYLQNMVRGVASHFDP